MIEYNKVKEELKIIIPLVNFEELFIYQQSILNILNQISLQQCKKEQVESIQNVYKLLNDMLPERDLFFQNKNIYKEYRKLKNKYPKAVLYKSPKLFNKN